jgi:hypothetical protein
MPGNHRRASEFATPALIDENIMETKTARLTLLIDPVKKKAFEELCAAQDITPSQVVRQLIRDYMERHGADYATRSLIGTSKPGNPA